MGGGAPRESSLIAGISWDSGKHVVKSFSMCSVRENVKLFCVVIIMSFVFQTVDILEVVNKIFAKFQTLLLLEMS